MGNSSSTQAPPPPPPPAAPQPVVSLPLQRVPTLDGASGLHYSGRIYMNQLQQLSTDVCQGASASVDQIGDVMANSLSSTTLPVDDTTKRISATALQGYVQNLIDQGQIPGTQPSFDEQVQADKTFHDAVQAEYCFYESRYLAALQQFLALIADPRGADPNSVNAALSATIQINKRLNSLLEILQYVSNDRAQKVNARSPQLDQANQLLDDKLTTLAQQKEFLERGDVRLRTQEEMIRYSAEKSRAMNIQIMFFVALNVVALGTVLTVYKNVGAAPGV
jgi:hypothetical protein